MLALTLVMGFPSAVRHAVNVFAHRFVLKLNLLFFGGFAVPATQAITAKSRQTHQVEILHVFPFLQVLDQAPKSSRFQSLAGVRIKLRYGHISLLYTSRQF